VISSHDNVQKQFAELTAMDAVLNVGTVKSRLQSLKWLQNKAE
jgi:hypothetical protein